VNFADSISSICRTRTRLEHGVTLKKDQTEYIASAAPNDLPDTVARLGQSLPAHFEPRGGSTCLALCPTCHSSSPQIVDLALITADHRTQERNQSSGCHPNRMRRIAGLESSGKGSGTSLPTKCRMPLAVVDKENLRVTLISPDADNLPRSRISDGVSSCGNKRMTWPRVFGPLIS
jgi:hypothetical protein